MPSISPPFGARFLASVSLAARSAPEKPFFIIGKYITRCCLAPRASSEWLSAIAAEPVLADFVQNHPRLLLKPFRPYLNSRYAIHERLQALLQHYSFVGSRFPREILACLNSRTSVNLASIEGKCDSRFYLNLAQTDKFDREGELLLELCDHDGQRVACAAFTLVGTHEPQIRVGCLQGASSREGRDLVRRATRGLHGSRPKNFLIEMLYMLAESWGISRIVCVGNRGQIYKTRSLHVFADYDSFWRDLGGFQNSNGEFILPREQKHRPPEEVRSGRRAEYRRRLEMRQAARQQMFRQFQQAAVTCP